MRFLPIWLGALLLVLAATPTDAGKVKLWQQSTPAHFDKAKFQGVVVSSDGIVRLSRKLEARDKLDAAHVWDLAFDRKNRLYAATGDEGKLYKIEPGQPAKVVHADKDSQIFSLVTMPDDVVYAGTGPSGKILRVSPQGQVETVAEGLDSYVWSLAYHAESKTLYAATGPKGKIYRIKAGAKAEVFYASKQEHILCLALDAAGNLYAGTDKGGLVYRIDPLGKAFVLYQASQPEVRALLVTPEAVYAGTSSPIARKGGATGKSGDGPAVTGSGENAIYRIAHDGGVREIFRDKTMILRLARQASGKLLVATGMQGQLFELDEATKERTELVRLESGLIHCFANLPGTQVYFLGAGDPGKLYELGPQLADKGTITSEVFDAKMQSRWGALTWRTDYDAAKGKPAANGRVTVACRSGNVADPDDTWSAWSDEQDDGAKAQAKTPAARYFQFRATLSSNAGASSPEFRQFALRYQTINQAPEIASLDVPDTDTASVDSPKKLKLKWTATDPNDDELTYNLHFRKEGWHDWVLLEENLEKKDFDWDTTGVPSGVYQIKVTASDRRDNPPEEALTATRVSGPVTITNLPPQVEVSVKGTKEGRVVVEVVATDGFARLTEASIAVDGKRWLPLFPVDGLFDSKAETFRFETDPLSPGTHVLVARVRNAAGHTGSGESVVALPRKLKEN